MYKVIFNQALRAQFVNREDADEFVDVLCGAAEEGTEIAVIGPDDKPIYGFTGQGDHWEA